MNAGADKSSAAYPCCDTPPRPTLLVALLGSVLLHVALILAFPQSIPLRTQEKLDYLKVKLRPPQESRKAAIQHPRALPRTADSALKTSAPEAPAFTPDSVTLPQEKLIFQSEDLDAGVVVINEPELEPPYGFADDVHGKLELSMLIDEQGEVKWVGAGSSALNNAAVAYITQAFKMVKFSVPMVSGKPVMTIYRVEVTIGENNRYPASQLPGSP